jgi:hypothetical protein
MSGKSLVGHLFRSDDIQHRKENIISFLSSKLDQQQIDCDYLESLGIIVSHLPDFSTNTEPPKLVFNEQWISNVLNTILTKTCIPTLRMPRPTAYDGDKRDKMKIFELTYELVSNVVCKGPLENAQCIWSLLLKSLQSFVDECKIGFDVGHEDDGSLLPVCYVHKKLGYTYMAGADLA